MQTRNKRIAKLGLVLVVLLVSLLVLHKSKFLVFSYGLGTFAISSWTGSSYRSLKLEFSDGFIYNNQLQKFQPVVVDNQTKSFKPGYRLWPLVSYNRITFPTYDVGRNNRNKNKRK